MSIWPLEPIGALCELDPPKSQVRSLAGETSVSFVPMNDLGTGGQPVSGQEERALSEVYKGYTYFAEGDVLLAKITPCFENGKLGIASGLQNQVGFGSSEFMVLRSGPKLSARYLALYLSQDLFREQGAKAMTGAVGHKRVPKEWVKSFQIPLPPLAEQQRIVAILDEALSGVDATIAVVETQLKQDRELRFAAFTNFLPTSGSVVTLAEHVEILVGFAFKSSDYVTDPSSIRLRGDNITPGAIRWADAKGLPRDHASDFGRYQLAVDDVVVAMDRPWIKTGLKQARLTEQDVPSLLVQRVARLRCRPTLKVDYLQHLIASPLFERHVVDHAGGSGVPHISGGQLGAFSFVLPRIEDQAAIIERLNEFQLSHSALARIRLQKIAALAELRQSLLARAFSGELTREPLAA